MVVYLDLVMILNFLVDFLLLLGTNRLAGYPTEIGRCALAAALGGLYGGGCLLPGFHFLGNGLWRIVFLCLMASVAYGWRRNALRRGTVFLLLSLALGGMAVAMGEGKVVHLLLSASAVWLLCRMGFSGQLGQEYVSVSIAEGDRKISLLALKDTGNTLRDPITGEQVLIIGADAAEKLTGLTSQELASPMETMVRHSGFRLIPYHAVGQSGGMLLAKRYADVTIGNYRGAVLIAFAPEIMDRSGCYQALTGGAV